MHISRCLTSKVTTACENTSVDLRELPFVLDPSSGNASRYVELIISSFSESISKVFGTDNFVLLSPFCEYVLCTEKCSSCKLW